MSSFAPSITFQALTESAFPMLQKWLSTPHVRLWWGEPEHEIELMRQSMTHPFEQGFVASADQQEFGYIQQWRPTDYPNEEPWAADLPKDAVGIDAFIGDTTMIGKGLGTAMVVAFCAKLFVEGADYLVIDPDAKNMNAVKAYGKAGFKHLLDYTTPTGVTHLMDLTRSRFQRTL